ncbi:site-2 protease family protein [Polynucleobacter sp. JS-Safj-400b-B2]|uniref:M50 family metallopeptidase n=1 Tax=Polynucleobacter sp. JS-Safj-400b-B2 TaxID=2576921 RepID=UPI001C0D5685|nr:site-2 protease family protein [Polynucleobacter sp. JS-Safj-400b-B2]MBU3624792.1 site-2 protease family protein [Polynucleobacter sp. JS-Safj-400b-B2]
MQALITLAAFLLTLGVLVSFHEFGHFFAARCCGVRVLRFAVGFGKPLFTYHAKNKTEWVLASIPLGGYVKLLDGRDPQQVIAPAEESQAFDRKPLWQRSLIVAAGPFANFFLAIIFFALIYVSGAPQLPAVLQSPPEHSVAAKLGLTGGDRVIGWQDLGSEQDGVPLFGDFSPVPSWNALRWSLMDALTGENGFALKLETPSGGSLVKSFYAKDLPKITPDKDPMLALGILPALTPLAEWQDLKLGPIDALLFASKRVWVISKVSARLMAGLFTGNTSLKQLGGPISIADMAGKSAQVGWQPFLAFLALMSISIGLLNLLPFPMLDGGQLLYDAWELVAGKRISTSMQGQLQKVGFFLLISMSLLALFNDLQRYISP